MHEIIILVAKYFIVIPIIVAIVVFIQLKDKKDKRNFAIAVIAGGIATILAARLASSLWYDPRPFVVGHFTPLISHAADNGFPSDHTLLSAFIGWTILQYSRKYGIIVLIAAALIGTARVLAGVHHVSDIIGSFVISGLVTLLVIFVMNKIKFTKKSAI
ncbi:MAG: phosphatase family protein [Candidatus Saccharibacteria bacterium]|nr:phosphatase family protein [Candidatus Saccharibacteria bacterium]